jgi:hypothetical protein
MKKQAQLIQTVFDKDKFHHTVDNKFTQLVDTVDPSLFDIDLATQEDFWILYDKFFYQIPKKGDINSHEYLINTSSDYANYDAQQEEIAALLEEIAELRQENLELRQQSTSNTLSGKVSPLSDSQPLTNENTF